MNSIPKISIEFARVMVFWGLCLLGGAWWLGLLDATQLTITTNAEESGMHQRKKVFRSGKTVISGAQWQDSTIAFEGQFSVAIPPKNYGLGFEYPWLRGTETLKLSVWRYNSDQSANRGIIVAEIPGHFWQACETVVNKMDNGWQHLQGEIIIPGQHRGKTLKVYCWNNGNQTIYFDQFEVVISKEEKP